MNEKQPSILWAHRDDIKGGKYLVLRRDNTVLGGPHFVLGPRDPNSPWCMRLYAIISFLRGWNWGFAKSCWRHAGMMKRYRLLYGDGDPDRGPHRKDDPEIILRMIAEE